MELHQIRYFVAVARHLNFTRAAESIPITLPTLSQQLRKLEEELGVRLFERSPQKVTLTPAGLAFRPPAEALLEMVKTAGDSVRAFQSEALNLTLGILSVASAMGLWVRLTKFQKECPKVQLQVSEGGSADLWQLMENGRLEAAVLVPPPGAYDKTLQGLLIDRDQIVVLLPVEHPLARQKALTLEMIREEALILTDPKHNNLQRYFLEACEAQGISPRVSLLTQFATTYIEAVSKKMGLAVVCEKVAQNLAKNGLVLRGFDPPLHRPLALVYPAASPHGETLRALHRALASQ